MARAGPHSDEGDDNGKQLTHRPLPLSLQRPARPLVTTRAPWQDFDCTLLSSRCKSSDDCLVPEWRYKLLLANLQGGAARVVAPWEELSTDLLTSELVVCSSEWLAGSASRLAAPFLELSRDAIGGLEDACQRFRRGSIGSALEGHFTRMFVVSNKWYNRLAEQPLAIAFNELSEDSGLKKDRVLPMMLGLLMAAPHPASGAILLCGYTITMKAILLSSSAVLGIGSWVCLNRHPNDPNRDVQNKASLALAIAGGTYLGLAYLGGVPPEIAQFFNIPEVSMHYVIDLAVNPLMLANLGYLSGCSTSSMLMTIMFSELSSTALLASTMSQFNTTQSSLLLCAGVGMMGVTGYTLNKLPECAGNLSTLNRARVQISGDFLLFSWTLFPMLSGLTIAEVISPDAAIRSFALLDALSKIGVSHISIKSNQVIKNARDRFRQAEANRDCGLDQAMR